MFLLIGLGLYVFVKFNCFTLEVHLLISILSGFALASFIWLAINMELKKGKVTSVSNFMLNHLIDFITFICMLILFAYSVENKLIWNDKNEMIEVLKIEWTIFTLSIALFVFWPSIMGKYFNQNKFESEIRKNPISIYIDLCKKRSLSLNLKWSSSTILYIIVNLAFLLFSTYNAFFLEYNIFTQTIMIFSFYLSTNTIFKFTIDIVGVIFKMKRIYLSEFDVSVEELNKGKQDAESFSAEFKKLLEKYGDIEKMQNTDLSIYPQNEAVLKVVEYVNMYQEYENLYEGKNDNSIGKMLIPYFEEVISNEKGSFTCMDVINKTNSLSKRLESENKQVPTNDISKKRRGRPKGSKNKKKD